MVDSSQDNTNTNPDIFNYYYSKLSDTLTKPKVFDDIKETEEITKLIIDIKAYKEKKCGPIELEQSCKITDKDI